MTDRDEYLGPWATGTMHLKCGNNHEWSVKAEYSENADRWNILKPNSQSDAQCPECEEYHTEKRFEQDIE